MNQQEGVCDVCRLLDNDISQKMVSFCNTCKAWLCQRCELNPWRRFRAMRKAKKQ